MNVIDQLELTEEAFDSMWNADVSEQEFDEMWGAEIYPNPLSKNGQYWKKTDIDLDPEIETSTNEINTFEEVDRVQLYFGYRFYEPRTKKFMTRDPLGEDGSLNMLAYCSNNPFNRYEYLGAADFKELKIKINEVNDDVSRIIGGVNNYQSMLNEFQTGKREFPNNLDPKLYETWVHIIASMKYGSENVQSDIETAKFGIYLNQKAAQCYQREISDMYVQAAWLDHISKNKNSPLDPKTANWYFDTDNPRYKEDKKTMFWYNLNPARDIARHTVNEDYGEASLAFGKEVAIWSAFGIAGEIAVSGRVALGTGFRSIEIGVARSPAGQLGIHAAWRVGDTALHAHGAKPIWYLFTKEGRRRAIEKMVPLSEQLKLQTVSQVGAKSFFQREGVFIFKVPVLNPNLALAREGTRTFSCVTSPISAFNRGNYYLPSILLGGSSAAYIFSEED